MSKSRGGTTFINFGGRFPNHVFYAVIFKKYAHKFQSLDRLVGKSVAISGTIDLYKGKPQIILFSPDQIVQR
ncbi:nucleotide-binding protein [Phaeobacter gallaeciensis]|uniref:Nucleotide-binding protein n=1 Tax=Phaeobacter gallaeciensis TaxID=60890 RepID=A0A1B0ZP79_9RHOB|nr:nucleotide-binding protein [Phaeobacter gallaeciensis]